MGRLWENDGKLMMKYDEPADFGYHYIHLHTTTSISSQVAYSHPLRQCPTNRSPDQQKGSCYSSMQAMTITTSPPTLLSLRQSTPETPKLASSLKAGLDRARSHAHQPRISNLLEAHLTHVTLLQTSPNIHPPTLFFKQEEKQDVSHATIFLRQASSCLGAILAITPTRS